jgi:hypothetical protein
VIVGISEVVVVVKFGRVGGYGVPVIQPVEEDESLTKDYNGNNKKNYK